MSGNAIQSAETLAALRAAVSGDARLEYPCEDRFARHFLGPKYRMLTAIRPRALLRRVVNLLAPGSYCFAIARTSHFDRILVEEARRGLRQLVLLGAGYDTRAHRFRDGLRGVRVFEIDHPGTQRRKVSAMRRFPAGSTSDVTYVPVDLAAQPLREALLRNGFSAGERSLFLWEGVSYYLPRAAVEEVLDFIAGCPGGSVLFDYATRRFLNGDYATHGARQVAAWLKKIKEPFLFGMDGDETPGFLADRRLELLSDFGPENLENAYLRTRSGKILGPTFGHVRIAHARALGQKPPDHAIARP